MDIDVCFAYIEVKILKRQEKREHIAAFPFLLPFQYLKYTIVLH